MSDELYRLLGLSADVDVTQLRKAYEEQMAAAARSHDHTRALQLSSALDRAPESVRSAMYRRMTTRVGPIGPEPVAARTRTLTRRPARTSGRPTRAAGSRSLLRPILIMVVVAASVAGVAWLNRDRFGSSSPQFVRHHVPDTGVSQHSPPSQNAAVASALRDTHRVVDGVRSCQQIGDGALPESTSRPGTQVLFSCGTGTVQFPLEPGNTVEYLRTGRRDFRVIVTASDGEFVTYNSRTDTYSG